MTASDFHAYLPNDILVKVDRVSMFVSLEVRSPLLDYRIVDFVFSKVPGSLKVNKEGTKIILKKLAQRLLPPSLSLNRKGGFGIPLRTWLQQGIGDLSPDLLAARTGLFDREAVKKIIHAGGEGLILHDRRIFALIGFEFWRQAYGGLH